MYKYEEQREDLFTENGLKMIMAMHGRALALIAHSGAAMAQNIMSSVSGDTWMMLACLDYLVETKVIREIEQRNECAGQHRIFVKH